jgi:hypothetical protein
LQVTLNGTSQSVDLNHPWLFSNDISMNGSSEIVYFTVDAETPSSAATLIVASGVPIAVIGLGLLVYFKKRNQ